MPDRPDLTALIGSRICHDLISPIGAIGNGVELLMMDGVTKGPEIALIAESVANANARIRFFRVAFGASSTDQRIGRPEVLAILSDLTRGGRLSIDWRGPADLPRREVKLAFLLIQCLESAMAFGGKGFDGMLAQRMAICKSLWDAGKLGFLAVPQIIRRSLCVTAFASLDGFYETPCCWYLIPPATRCDRPAAVQSFIPWSHRARLHRRPSSGWIG